MNNVSLVTACRNLFQIQPFLAHGIIPTLRMEDIKIALAKQLHNTTLIQKSISPESLVREYIENYQQLADYINQHNLEVLLTIDNFLDSPPKSLSYLYPLPDLGKTVQMSFSSLAAKKELFFNGTLPPRKLRLGSFLYYRGIISYYNGMESIAWQKNRRPLIGQMAMQIGKLSAEGFARIIVHVKNGECFGEVARKYNLLSDTVIAALVKAQEKYDCRLGRFFIKKSLLSEQEVLVLEKEMRIHNRKFR